MHMGREQTRGRAGREKASFHRCSRNLHVVHTSASVSYLLFPFSFSSVSLSPFLRFVHLRLGQPVRLPHSTVQRPLNTRLSFLAVRPLSDVALLSSGPRLPFAGTAAQQDERQGQGGAAAARGGRRV